MPHAKSIMFNTMRAQVSFRRAALPVGYRIIARRADLKPERLPKIKLPAQVAEEAMPDLTHGKARRKRAAGLALLGKLDPLPATPKIPFIVCRPP
jgi:hypothetical protein